MFSLSIRYSSNKEDDDDDRITPLIDEFTKGQLQKVIFYIPPFKTRSFVWDAIIKTNVDGGGGGVPQKPDSIKRRIHELNDQLEEDSDLKDFFRVLDSKKKRKDDIRFSDIRLKLYFGGDDGGGGDSSSSSSSTLPLYIKVRDTIRTFIKEENNKKSSFMEKFKKDNEHIRLFEDYDNFKRLVYSFLLPYNIRAATYKQFKEKITTHDAKLVKSIRKEVTTLELINNGLLLKHDNETIRKMGKTFTRLLKHVLEDINKFDDMINKLKSLKLEENAVIPVSNEYDTWQTRKKGVLYDFLYVYKSIYNTRSIIYHHYKGVQLRLKSDISNEEGFKQEMTRIIWKTVFNGLTLLKVENINTSYITFSIESKSLCIPLMKESGEEEEAKKMKYLTYPLIRLQGVEIRLNVKDLNTRLFQFTGVYPIWNTYLNIQFNSPLKDLISSNAMAHYGSIQHYRDIDLYMLFFILENGGDLGNLFKSVKSYLIIDNYKKHIIDNESGRSTLYSEYFNLIEDQSSSSSFPHDSFYLYLPSLHRNRRRTLIKMVYHDKDEKEHPGLYSFMMSTQNSLQTTLSIEDIHEMMKIVDDQRDVEDEEEEDERNRVKPILTVDRGTELPYPLTIFINTLMPNEYESLLTKKMKETRTFWEYYIMALYSYYVNYLEIERDKESMKRYGNDKDKNFKGQIDDWLSTTHIIKPKGYDNCLIFVYSTFSLYQAILKLRFEALIGANSFNKL